MGKPTSIAVGLAAASAALTGCGTASSGDVAGAEAVENVAAVEARADELYGAIWGGAAEKEGGHYLSFRALNDPLKACMTDRGFNFKPRFDRIWSGYIPNSTSDTWMGALNRPPSATALASARSYRDEADPPPLSEEERSLEYRDAIRTCGEPDVDADSIIRPTDVEELGYAFGELVIDVEEQLGSIEPYTECMKEAGVDYTSSGSEGWTGLYLHLTDEMPLPPLPGEEPTAEWETYLEFEERALQADSFCRGDKYAEGLTLLEPMLEEFASEHAMELQSLRDEWTDILRRATEAGFSP